MFLKKKTNKQKIESLRKKKEKQRYKHSVKQLDSYFSTCKDLLEFESVEDYYIQINKNLYMVGVEIIPPKLSASSYQDKIMWVQRYNNVLNTTQLLIHHTTIMSKIDIDKELFDLRNKIAKEPDAAIQTDLMMEYENYETLAASYPRNRFFELVIGNIQDKKFIKDIEDLYNSYRINGFHIKELGRFDFLDYLSYVFENPLITNYHFTRGLFDYVEDNKEKEDVSF